MLNPIRKDPTNARTGSIREDSKGSGFYGRPRGNRIHKGVDFICEPYTDVVAPISGKIIREKFPYGDDLSYKGLLLRSASMEITLFYVELDTHLIGETVTAGERIGFAQDISLKYGSEMKPHVHLQIDSIDPMIFVDNL